MFVCLFGVDVITAADLLCSALLCVRLWLFAVTAVIVAKKKKCSQDTKICKLWKSKLRLAFVSVGCGTGWVRLIYIQMHSLVLFYFLFFFLLYFIQKRKKFFITIITIASLHHWPVRVVYRCSMCKETTATPPPKQVRLSFIVARVFGYIYCLLHTRVSFGKKEEEKNK